MPVSGKQSVQWHSLGMEKLRIHFGKGAGVLRRQQSENEPQLCPGTKEQQQPLELHWQKVAAVKESNYPSLFHVCHAAFSIPHPVLYSIMGQRHYWTGAKAKGHQDSKMQKHLPLEERLREMALLSPENRLFGGDWTAVYPWGSYQIKGVGLFKQCLVGGQETMGINWNTRFRLDVGKKKNHQSSIMRPVKQWNRLPTEVVLSLSNLVWSQGLSALCWRLDYRPPKTSPNLNCS